MNNEFPSLMSELAQRYIHVKAQQEQESNNQEIEELRNEILEMKETLRKIHPSNIMKRPSVASDKKNIGDFY